ncbi:MAG: PQQ-dependent sugar dehydrogenase [Planctomycetota bacterium]
MGTMIFTSGLWIALSLGAVAQTPGPDEPIANDDLHNEEAMYRIVDLKHPDDITLEVSGLTWLPDDRLMAATRRGEVYIVENALSPDGSDVVFKRFAHGLQEPLGLLVKDGWIYFAQRGELSRMRDTNGDDRVDEIETICDTWRVSGNYHEYNFGPRLDPDGNFWITTNKPFGGEPFGRVDWRGWALRITPDGEMIPTACGLRSPAGLAASPWGEMFYTDNQGEWCGASKLSHLEPGDFHGHPWGLPSAKREEWKYPYPGDPVSGRPMPDVHKEIPSFKLPAVWFPYDKMGKSPSGMVWDQTGGRFGPFEGQLFVGDQHHSSIMRVFLERVNGHWQGACFPFRYGFQSGVLRMAWSPDAKLFVGMTNRGWGSRGNSTEGLQRLDWTGRTPFEIREMRVTRDGFRLVFTRPVDAESARELSGYRLESYTYLLHSTYGSPEVEKQTLSVSEARVSRDGLSVELVVPDRRRGYVHELHAMAIRSEDALPLLHTAAYYTLIELPE